MNKTSITAISAATLLLVGCGGSQGRADESSNPEEVEIATKLIDPATLTVCTSPNPGESTSTFSPDGVNGFDDALAQEVASQLGLKLKQVSVDLTSISNGSIFTNKRCDIATSLFAATNEKAPNVRFTKPYFSDNQATLTPSDATPVADDMTRIAVVADSRGDTFTQERFQDGLIVRIDSLSAALETLDDGSAEGIITDEILAKHTADSSGGKYQTSETFTLGNSYAIALPADTSDAFVAQVDDALTKLAESDVIINLLDAHIYQ